MDDFIKVNALDRWPVYDGEFVLFASLFTKTPGNALIRDNHFKDFIYEADVQPNKGRAGILFRMSVPDERNDFQGFYAGLSDGFVELGRMDRLGQYIQLQNETIAAATSSSRLRVKAVGYEIYIYVDDMNTPKLHVKMGLI